MHFDDLVALTIHDVKNRLTLLAAHAEHQADKPMLHGLLETACTLTDLLAFYKAEQGLLDAQINACVPSDLVSDLAQEFSQQTQLTLRTDTAQAPLLAFYDPNLIRMVLLNPLYNAVRHARSTITLSVHAEPGWLMFTVADDGEGFPPEMLEPDHLTQHPTDGTGLGLVLAKKVAELHRHAGNSGSIRLSNQDGAVFQLRLPQ